MLISDALTLNYFDCIYIQEAHVKIIMIGMQREAVSFIRLNDYS